jgi:hypothetical protein
MVLLTDPKSDHQLVDEFSKIFRVLVGVLRKLFKKEKTFRIYDFVA